MKAFSYIDTCQKIIVTEPFNLFNTVTSLPGIVLTGSQAFGNPKSSSDIDFFISSDTVVGEGNIPIDDYLFSIGFRLYSTNDGTYKKGDPSIESVFRYAGNVAGYSGIDIQLITPEWFKAKKMAQELLLRMSFATSGAFGNKIVNLLSNKDDAKNIWRSVVETMKVFEDDTRSE